MYENYSNYGIESVNSDWDKTMHLHSRYEYEKPSLTFEYQRSPAWGEAMSNEKIVENYMELQTRIKEGGFGPL
jgi:hypothetical protein